MYKRLDPVKSLSWIIVILFLPYVGLLLYLFFGQNFRKTKIYSRKGVRDERLRRLMSHRQMKLFRDNPESVPAELHKFRKLIYLNLNGNRSVVGKNSDVEIFFSGKEALDSMYNAILQAKQHIHLQSYIIVDDETGNRFKSLLISKAKEGVEIRIIFDYVGSWHLRKEFVEVMQQAGIEVLVFAPV